MPLPLIPPGVSIDVAPLLGWFILAVLSLALLGLLVAFVSLIIERVTRVRARPGYDLALLQLGEARGRQQILDDVRMLEHGQLKAHVLAVQQCITARSSWTTRPPCARRFSLRRWSRPTGC